MSLQANRYVDTFYEDIKPRVKTSKHHRKLRAHHGDNSERNLIELPHNKHMFWHGLFRDFTPERIAEEITNIYIDPDYQMIAVRKPVSRNLDEALKDIDKQFRRGL